MAGSRIYVDSPTTTPLPFGLLSVVESRGQDAHWQQGVEYQSDNCVVTLATTSGYCIAPAGTNEVQTITITGAPTGGTFTLNYNGQITDPIPYNATAAQVQTALEGLPQFAPGDVAVTGAAPAWTVTYTGNFASTNVSVLSGNGAFTGGASPGITVNTTQQGDRVLKTIGNPSGAVATADPFTVYLIRSCAPVGDADAQARAMKMFNGSEGVGVEQGFWAQITAAGSGAVNITPPAGQMSMSIGLALIEQYASTHYGGRATIHMPRVIASQMGATETLERHGNHMETKLGNLVAAGGGYGPNGPSGTSTSSTEGWIIATGDVSLWAGAADVHGPILRRAVSGQPVNEWIVMVERTYLTSPDCMIAACKVPLGTA